MIAAHWQDLVAGLAVVAALVYYVRRRWRARGEACEGCPSAGCATNAETPARGPALISVESLGQTSAKAKAAREPR